MAAITKVLVLLLIGVLTVAGPAHGQPQPGDLGIFFSATPTSGADAVCKDVVSTVPFRDIFVVSFDVPGGMEAYEFSVQLPAGLLITGGRILPAGATDFGLGDDAWIVGTGGVCHGAVGPFVLVRYAAPLFLTDPGSDRSICLGAPTSCVYCDGVPDYLVCDSPGNLHHFGTAYRGCALINPSGPLPPVSDRSASFGGLKSRF